MMTLTKFARDVADNGDAYVVDRHGSIHVMSWAAYVALPASALDGCNVALTVERALEFAARSAHFGWTSTNATHDHLMAIRRKGYIRWEGTGRRALPRTLQVLVQP